MYSHHSFTWRVLRALLSADLSCKPRRQAACRAQANRIGGHGGALGSFLPGGDLFANSECELNREQHGGVFSLWSRSSRSYFSGMEDGLSLNDAVRTTMVAAD